MKHGQNNIDTFKRHLYYPCWSYVWTQNTLLLGIIRERGMLTQCKGMSRMHARATVSLFFVFPQGWLHKCLNHQGVCSTTYLNSKESVKFIVAISIVNKVIIIIMLTTKITASKKQKQEILKAQGKNQLRTCRLTNWLHSSWALVKPSVYQTKFMNGNDIRPWDYPIPLD